MSFVRPLTLAYLAQVPAGVHVAFGNKHELHDRDFDKCRMKLMSDQTPFWIETDF